MHSDEDSQRDRAPSDSGADSPSTADQTGADHSVSVLRRTFMQLVGGGVLVGGTRLSGLASGASDGWSIVALPDTQKYVETSSLVSYPQDQTDWIVANRDAENIVFVSHEGDLVENGSVTAEWERIDGVMDTLDGDLNANPDGLVPYSAPPGDHDWAVEEDRSSSTENYRQYFGQSRFQGRSWFGGSAPNDLSHYQLFSAGGYDFLHMDLEWEAPGSTTDASTALGWAQSVLDQYPDRPTIVTTHSYLWDGNPPGRTTFVQENNNDGSSGEQIWSQLVEPNPQVFMVLCGNFHEGSGSDNGEYHQVSTNAAGFPVYELLANYQDYPNGGNGWLRLVRFQPGGGSGSQDRIQVRTYSPSLDQFATDASSQFSFDLDFQARFTLTETPAESLVFQQGTGGYDGTVDTFLRESRPTRSFATAPELDVDAGSGRDEQALVRFENIVGAGSTQVPPGATVSSAKLTLETTNNGDGANVHRMLQPWSDTDTWDSFGGDGVQADGIEAQSTVDSAIGPNARGTIQVDVTASVQAWADGQPNYGWAFLPVGTNGWDFSSAEGATPPSLSVNYQTTGGGTDTNVAVTTDAATDVGGTTATLNGTLSDLGGATSVDLAFEYRETGASTWNTTPTQTLTEAKAFETLLDALASGTDYEFRATAEANDGDLDTGTTQTFTTSADPTVAVTTDAASEVSETGATLNGTLSDLGGASSADVAFEYRESGATTWTGTPTQTLTTTGSFGESVTGLTSGTDYEFRALATASDGDTATGSTQPFTTTSPSGTPGTATFQEGVDGYDGTVDTFLREHRPSRDFATASELDVDAGSGRDEQALVRFENVVGTASGQVPTGATIQSATLTLQTTNSGDGADLHRMLSSWADTDSWDDLGGGIQADGVEAASSPDATAASVGTGTTTIDVTPSVQAWADGQANNGWVFLSLGTNGWDFYSAEGAVPPRLDVNYEAGGSGGSTGVDVSTDPASNVGETTATLNGTLSSLGGADSVGVTFEYRTVGASEWSTTGFQTLTATGSFSEALQGLASDTGYEFRAVAIGDGDTDTGLTRSFTTTTDPTVAVTTDDASAVGETTATLNGTLTDLGGASSADVGFEYRESGTSDWTATPTQTRTATGSFSEAVDGLSGGTAYEFRAIATASDGDTATGSTLTVTTTSSPGTPGTATFQQGVDGYGGTVDTFVREHEPSRNFATFVELDVDGTSGRDEQTLLRFEGILGTAPGQIPPGATISSATLTVQTTNSGDGADLHRLLQSWAETDSWDDLGTGIQADGVEAASNPDTTVSSVGTGTTTIDVTPSVQAWADGQANYGWAFLSLGTNGWDFYSAEGTVPPRLDVSYE